MLLDCTRCHASLPVWVIKAGDAAMCPACNAGLTIRVFPALLAPPRELNPDDLRIEAGEASCFYHLSKRAAASCARCGRFVCALCAVEFDGAVWCPGCLSDAHAGRKHVRLENRRLLWDSIALGAATWPFVLLLWPALPGSLAAIFISIRYWKRPGSLIPRTKWRFILAILISLAELVLFAVLVYSFVQGVRQTAR
jgi:hypothetical protein